MPFPDGLPIIRERLSDIVSLRDVNRTSRQMENYLGP